MELVALVASLIPSLLLAGYLRWRRVKALVTIAVAGLLLPAWVAFDAFVYPADPEAAMWAAVAIPVSYFWGLAAAGVGYGVTALALRGKQRSTSSTSS